jgi:predicted dehydrogenase
MSAQIHTTTNYQELFSMGLDGVVIATPPTTHYPIARDCLMHGLHILVEKPLTLNSQHAEDLLMLAADRDRIVMVGHTFEYNGAVHALKDIITSGELGDIFYISTLRLNLGLFQPELNVLWDLAPHDISMLRFLLGSEPLAIGASGASYIFKDVYDIAFLCLEFPDQVRAHVRVSWLDPCKVRQVTVVGSEKMAVFDDVATSEKIRIYDKGVRNLSYTDTFGEFQLQYHHGDITIPHIGFSEPLRQECEDFLRSIATGQQPRSNGVSGLNVVRIIETAEQSLSNHGTHIPISWQRDGQEHVAV